MKAVVPEHDLGALVALDDVLGHERVELEHRRQPDQRRLGGVLHVYPDAGVSIRHRGSHVVDGLDDPAVGRAPHVGPQPFRGDVPHRETVAHGATRLP